MDRESAANLFAPGGTAPLWVCTAWQDAFTSQGVWRKVTVDVNRDILTCPEVFTSSLTGLSQFGRFTKRLHILGNIASNFCQVPPAEFWEFLQSIDLQLEVLFLEDWWTGYPSVEPLADFVRSQRNLQHVQLHRTYLVAPELNTLLGSLVEQSCVKVLSMSGDTAAFEELVSYESYLTSFSKMSCLHTLSVDYALLRDEVMLTLARTVPGRLGVLNATVTHPPLQVVSDDAWASLEQVCPNLQVSITFWNSSIVPRIMQILTSRIPLRSLKISWNRAQMTKNFSIRDFLTKVVSLYPGSLENLEIRLRENIEVLDDLLLEVLWSCERLNNLNFTGLLCNIETVFLLGDAMAHIPHRFTEYYARPHFLNEHNRKKLMSRRRTCETSLRDQGVKFILEDPANFQQ